MPNRVERYLARLDRISGGLEPCFTPIESTKPGLEGVTVITYEDLPEPGFLIGITYGLSLANHSDWRLGRPELCISVRSTDLAWPLAMGWMAESLRGSCPFSYGNTLGFGQKISPDSDMTEFVIFAPAVLDREDFLGIDVGDCAINLAGCYPIHASERDYIRQYGLRAFWDLDWDPYDVRRAPAV